MNQAGGLCKHKYSSKEAGHIKRPCKTVVLYGREKQLLLELFEYIASDNVSAQNLLRSMSLNDIGKSSSELRVIY